MAPVTSGTRVSCGGVLVAAVCAGQVPDEDVPAPFVDYAGPFLMVVLGQLGHDDHGGAADGITAGALVVLTRYFRASVVALLNGS